MPYASSLPKSPPSTPQRKRSHSDRSASAKAKIQNDTREFIIKALLVSFSIFGVYWILAGLGHFLNGLSHGHGVHSGEISQRHRPSLEPFEEHHECGISLEQLYTPASAIPVGKLATKPKICKNRAALLEAMSGGGRHGFDAPYVPNGKHYVQPEAPFLMGPVTLTPARSGCNYRWYTAEEICMILDRFDGVVFVGDGTLRHIYAAFNILLREDLALGGMEQWKMSAEQLKACRCDHQFTRSDCRGFMVGSSDEVRKHNAEGAHGNPYACDRMPHFFLPVSGSPAPATAHKALEDLLAKHPMSYKPVPIIHSIGPSASFTWTSAADSMDEWLGIADASGRNTPILWVGPQAAGHLLPPDRIMSQGNNALWHYSIQTGKEAAQRGIEMLGLYNMTLQASSWDGMNYGERVALVQAMMIINWLSRVEST